MGPHNVSVVVNYSNSSDAAKSSAWRSFFTAVLLHCQDNLAIRTQLSGGVPEARRVPLHCCKDELAARLQRSRGVFEE